MFLWMLNNSIQQQGNCVYQFISRIMNFCSHSNRYRAPDFEFMSNLVTCKISVVVNFESNWKTKEILTFSHLILFFGALQKHKFLRKQTVPTSFFPIKTFLGSSTSCCHLHMRNALMPQSRLNLCLFQGEWLHSSANDVDVNKKLQIMKGVLLFRYTNT